MSSPKRRNKSPLVRCNTFNDEKQCPPPECEWKDNKCKYRQQPLVFTHVDKYLPKDISNIVGEYYFDTLADLYPENPYEILRIIETNYNVLTNINSIDFDPETYRSNLESFKNQFEVLLVKIYNETKLDDPLFDALISYSYYDEWALEWISMKKDINLTRDLFQRSDDKLKEMLICSMFRNWNQVLPEFIPKVIQQITATTLNEQIIDNAFARCAARTRNIEIIRLFLSFFNEIIQNKMIQTMMYYARPEVARNIINLIGIPRLHSIFTLAAQRRDIIMVSILTEYIGDITILSYAARIIASLDINEEIPSTMIEIYRRIEFLYEEQE